MRESDKMPFTPTMTKEELLAAHQAIWLGVIKAKTTEVSKKKAIAKELGYSFYHGCAACHFAGITRENEPSKENCARCPFDWGTTSGWAMEQARYRVGNTPCEVGGSPYAAWKEGNLSAAVAVLHIPLKAALFAPKAPPIPTVKLKLVRRGKGGIELRTTTNAGSALLLLRFDSDGYVAIINNGLGGRIANYEGELFPSSSPTNWQIEDEEEPSLEGYPRYVKALKAIDPAAAKYILKGFSKEEIIEKRNLDKLMLWDKQPQGYVYWNRLDYSLREGGHYDS